MGFAPSGHTVRRERHVAHESSVAKFRYCPNMNLAVAPCINRSFAGCFDLTGRSYHLASLSLAFLLFGIKSPFPPMPTAQRGDHVFNAPVFIFFAFQHDVCSTNSSSVHNLSETPAAIAGVTRRVLSWRTIASSLFAN